MTGPFSHPILPATYDRAQARPDHSKVLFPESSEGSGAVFLQGADLNEMQSIARARNERLGGMVARDGDRIDGAEIVVNRQTGVVSLAAGRIYCKGDVRSVPAADLPGVPMTGQVMIGVRLTSNLVTSAQDPALLGLHPGTLAEGQPGAAREVERMAWGREGDGGTGALYGVYYLKDGVAIDQTPPPSLTGVNRVVGLYDYGAHGNYVVHGCGVRALGLSGGVQSFAIGAGEANIMGFKRTRNHDLRHDQPEEPSLQEIAAESRVFADTGTGTAVLVPYHTPVGQVWSVTVEKEVTEVVTRGAIAGSEDALAHNSVRTILDVHQGAVTYAAGVSFDLASDKINWGAGGAEPAPGSSYSVKYRYLDTIAAGAGYNWDATSITIQGGVSGGQVLLRYSWKLPRTDLLCLNTDGLPVYIKGLSAPANPFPPMVPTELLKLAEITNNWSGLPVVQAADIRAIPFAELWRYVSLLFDQQKLVGLERLSRQIDSREPVAKLGTFVDPLINDYYRDEGVAQTAAVFDGEMQLAIDVTERRFPMSAPLMLDWTHEVILAQDAVSQCVLVNPYGVGDLLPGELVLIPSKDLWTVHDTQWLSPVTRTISSGSGGVAVETVSQNETALELLRQIPLAFEVRGFLPHEHLAALNFDGISVLPPGLDPADGQGKVSGTFMIPARVGAGTKQVRASGSAGSQAETSFTGQGTLSRDVRQSVTTLVRQVAAVPRPAPVTRPSRARPVEGPGNVQSGTKDPQAGLFFLEESRFISGVNLKFCTRGLVSNLVYVELVSVRDGTPTQDVLAQCIVDMGTVVLNAWHTCQFAVPFWLTAWRQVAVVIKTDDMAHAISAADIGDADSVTGKRIAAMPYMFGPRHSSSDARSWTAHQKSRLTMQVLAAKFASVEKTFRFGTFGVTNMSDIRIPATVELPTEQAALRFEVVRENGAVIILAPGQSLALSEYVTEAIRVQAVLSGTQKVSPILYPDLQVLLGSLRPSGTYVSRAFKMGQNVRLNAWFKGFLPAGSTLTVACDDGAGGWTSLAPLATEALNGGWLQLEQRKTGLMLQSGRLKFTLAGTPAARPRIADLTAFAIQGA